MLRRALLLLALLLPVAAQAQSETRLRVSETGSVAVQPDELVASLRIEARAATAAAAQEQVNTAMAAALATARAVPGARVSTGHYATQMDRDKQEVMAQQSLNLRGPEALVELVGRLQAEGLLLDGITWQLSEPAALKARDDATRVAIRAVQERGASIARDLNLRVITLRDLVVDAAPEGRPMMMTARAASAPAVATEDITVTARVTADLLLRR